MSTRREIRSLFVIEILFISLLISVAIPKSVTPVEASSTYSEAWMWQIVILAHAPKYGYTDAQTSWSYENTVIAGPLASESTWSQTIGIEPDEGNCFGTYRRVKWRRTDVCQGMFITWTIVEYSDDYYDNWLRGTSTNDCTDDTDGDFTRDGYKSTKITSKYQYSTKQGEWDRRNGSGWGYQEVSAEQNTWIEAGISISIIVPSFGVTATFKVKNKLGSTWVYRYYFSAGHYWKWDYTDDAHLIWLFKLEE